MSAVSGRTEEQGQGMLQSEDQAARNLQPSKKTRKKFGTLQVERLVTEISQNLDQLFKANSREKRNSAWREVMKEVNKAGPTSHTISECKVRWNTYKRSLKQKVAKSESLQQLEITLSKTDIKIVKYFHIDDAIGTELEENPSDDPDGEPLSWTHNDSLLSSLLLPSEQSLSSNLPVASCTTNLTTADESQQRPEDLNAKLEQLIELQKCTNGLLTSIRDGICDQQKEMLHMQKLMSTQETTKDYSGVYEVSLKRQEKKQRHGEDRPE
ncbi:uncharacterized protein [Eleutherodactylus coqui]|uniref:uncharacterized protein n=1 Tax=Eleutherodactylus coqui TaxID=57060 RepID=UPI003462700C